MKQKTNFVPLLGLLFLISATIALFSFFENRGQEEEHIVSFSVFERLLDSGYVAEATVKKAGFNDYYLHGKLASPIDLETVDGKKIKGARRIFLSLPYSNIDNEVVSSWKRKGLKFSVEKENETWLSILLNFLPWLLILGFSMMFVSRLQKRMGGGFGEVENLRSSNARTATDKKTFADVAGCDEAKEEVKEVIDFLKEPSKFQKLGGKIPKGVLLVGPPGTGKTLLAKAVAGEAGVPFFSLSGSEFVEMFVGVGASRVRDLFGKARKAAPCVVFIDELDAIGRHRGAGLGGGHDEREQTLNQILVEMDGFQTGQTVIVIAATNRPDILDPALVRPGRFDRQIVVDRPDLKGREEILRIHTGKVLLSEEVDLLAIARATPGFVGADLANLVNEAALIAGRRGKENVGKIDFEDAKDRVTMGIAQHKLMNQKEKKVVAYHEAGHTLVAKVLPNTDPVNKVTIVPRGLSLGSTHSLPEEDRRLYFKNYLFDEISVLMGGRIAEEKLGLGITNGASNDIERATEIARKMVCEWGMSELGTITFGKARHEVFLGRDFGEVKNYSEETAKSIDEEIKEIILTRYNIAKNVLERNWPVLEALAGKLLEKETLEAEEIEEIVRPAVEREQTRQA